MQIMLPACKLNQALLHKTSHLNLGLHQGRHRFPKLDKATLHKTINTLVLASPNLKVTQSPQVVTPSLEDTHHKVVVTPCHKATLPRVFVATPSPKVTPSLVYTLAVLGTKTWPWRQVWELWLV